MPYYRKETYSTAISTPSWNLDPAIVPFNAAIAVTFNGTGTVAYKLQYTLNALDAPKDADSDANWVDWPDIPTGTAASAQTVIDQPVARIRLVIATCSGGATLQLQARQGFSTN